MQLVESASSLAVLSRPATLLLSPIPLDQAVAWLEFPERERFETGEEEAWPSCPLDDDEPTGPENEPGGFFQTCPNGYREVRPGVILQTGIPAVATSHGPEGERLARIDSYWHGGLNE